MLVHPDQQQEDQRASRQDGLRGPPGAGTERRIVASPQHPKGQRAQATQSGSADQQHK